MIKLDEIEHRTLQNWRSSISGEQDDELRWHDIDLIFRAVRQLGGAVSAWKNNNDRDFLDAMDAIESDVLELLSE